MTIRQRSEPGHPGPIFVETNIASFRDLVQRLTGLPITTQAQSHLDQNVFSERKTVHRPDRRSRGSFKLRQRTLKRQHGPDLIASPSKRQAIRMLMERHGDGVVSGSGEEREKAERDVVYVENDSSPQVEFGETPELLALFPVNSPNLQV